MTAVLGCSLVSPAFAASGVQEQDKLWPGEMDYVLSGYASLEKAQLEQSIGGDPFSLPSEFLQTGPFLPTRRQQGRGFLERRDGLSMA